MGHAERLSLTNLPPEILLALGDHLHVSDLGALRLTCTRVNDALSPLVRRLFHTLGVMSTPRGIASLLDMADHPHIAALITKLDLNSAVVLDTEDDDYPALNEQLSLLELEAHTAAAAAADAVAQAMRTGRRRRTEDTARPDTTLAHVLAQAFARLPNLQTVSADFRNPEYEDYRTAQYEKYPTTLASGSMLGYSTLSSQCVQPVRPGPAYVTALFWALLFGLAHAHESREEVGYARPKSICVRHVGVRCASFPQAMAYFGFLAPVLRDVDMVCLCIACDGQPPTELESDALAAFLSMMPQLRQLSLYGPEGRVDSGALSSLIGPSAPPLHRLESLELIAHDMTATVLCDILTSTRASRVRLVDVRLSRGVGDYIRGPAWVYALRSASAHHRAIGTTSTITTFELSDVKESGGHDSVSIEFARRGAPDDSRNCCFVLGDNDVDNCANVHRLEAGSDLFACVADELRFEMRWRLQER